MSTANRKPISKFTRWLLIITGSIAVGVGVIGIFLPLIPTTSPLLLAAACYIRSSDRLYNWLISNKFFGSYIRNYREKRGIPMRAKVVTISILWLTIAYSALFAVENIYVRLLLLAVAIGVTIHVAMIKTLRAEPPVKEIT